MGREIKRVDPSVNSHPLRKVWPTLLRPDELTPAPCHHCEQTGLNPASKAISDTFYDHSGGWRYDYGFAPDGSPASSPPWRIIGNCKSWCNSLEQDEVDHLAAQGRLMDFTHVWEAGKGWQRRADEYVPTADEVNYWNQSGIGHDAINRCILIRFRAEKQGVYGHCEHCSGSGELWESEAQKAASEAWRPQDPPAGSYWQLWETVSEGSPVTPAFSTSEQLVNYLVSHGDGARRYSKETAEELVSDGWAPSGVFVSPASIEAA